jgi:hypothetical protein
MRFPSKSHFSSPKAYGKIPAPRCRFFAKNTVTEEKRNACLETMNGDRDLYLIRTEESSRMHVTVPR